MREKISGIYRLKLSIRVHAQVVLRLDSVSVQKSWILSEDTYEGCPINRVLRIDSLSVQKSWILSEDTYEGCLSKSCTKNRFCIGSEIMDLIRRHVRGLSQ